MNSEQARQQAERKFKREERAQDGRKAMIEYEAQAVATRKKTARLKALRLAKEAQAAQRTPARKPVERRPARRGHSSHFSGSAFPNLIPCAGLFPTRSGLRLFNCENLKELVQLGRSPNEPNYLRTSDVASLGRQREPMSLAVHILQHIEPISLPCDAT